MGNIYCLIGPSGVGKSTLARAWGLKEIVSHRTRPIRKQETDGIDGHFISQEKFAVMNQHKDFLAQTVYVGHHYGVTKDEMKKADHEDVVYVVDFKGAAELKESLGDRVVMIELMGDDDVLRERMLGLGRSYVDVMRRIGRAEQDRKDNAQCDYHVENKQGELQDTLAKLERIRAIAHQENGVSQA